jgi:hypothetical protein
MDSPAPTQSPTSGSRPLGIILIATIIAIIIFALVYYLLNRHKKLTPLDRVERRVVERKFFGASQNLPYRDPILASGKSNGLENVVADILSLHEEAINQFQLLQRGEWATPSFLKFRAMLSNLLAKARSQPGRYPKSILEIADAMMVHIDTGADNLQVPDSDAWKRLHEFTYDLIEKCSSYLSAHMEIGTTVGKNGRGQANNAAEMISERLSQGAGVAEGYQDPDADADAFGIDTVGQNMLEVLDYLDSNIVGGDRELSQKSGKAYQQYEMKRTGKSNFPRARQGGYIPETSAEVTKTLYDVDTRRTPMGKIPGGTTTAYDTESTFVRFPKNSVNRSIFGPNF